MLKNNFIVALSTLFILMFNSSAYSFFSDLDALQRSKGPNSDECAFFENSKFRYPDTNDEGGLSDSDAWRCANQKITSEKGNLEFSLNFLEFNEVGKLRDKKQLDSLRDIFSTGSHFVVVYVHGWRHDAQKRDTDVKKFRTMLAYSRQFLNYRISIGDSGYKDHQVTGIYVAWPGRGRFDCNWAICDFTVAPSLFGRKKISDQISKSIVSELSKLSKYIKNRPTGNRSKILVTGHSLGGNILIRGINDNGMIVSKLKTHQSQDLLEAPIGDLVVLFNPASEVQNWIEIQRAVRNKLGLNNPNIRFGTVQQAGKNHRYFSKMQKPVIISLTSACEWPDFVRKSKYNKDLGNRKINCDDATSKLFSAYRIVSGNLGSLKSTAIGHLEPDDKCEFYDPKTKTCPLPANYQLLSYGTTHELEINVFGKNDIPRNTSFINAQKLDVARCEVMHGWLRQAKDDITPSSPNAVGWDAGYRENSARDWVNRKLRINAQFRHQIYRGFGKHGKVANYNITTANDPFWNVRALDTAIEKHGGFNSYPTWCAINQIILDDINAKK